MKVLNDYLDNHYDIDNIDRTLPTGEKLNFYFSYESPDTYYTNIYLSYLDILSSIPIDNILINKLLPP